MRVDHPPPAARVSPSCVIGALSLADCLSIRHRVLAPLRPLDSVRVPGDDTAAHLGGFVDNRPFGCLSLFDLGNRIVQLRKFAVLPEYQGNGLGSLMFDRACEDCRKSNFVSMTLDARTSATGFYLRQGLSLSGAPFFKGDVEYIRMVRPL